jgi:eukaryotic-like serine/threonine-protein kinase
LNTPLRIPGRLGNYLILTKLNKGGMADVFLGQPLYAPMHWVAVKTLLPKLAQRSKFIGMFRSEGNLGMMFNHPNIVRTWEVGLDESGETAIHYLAMDYVHGRDLGAVYRSFQRLDVRPPIAQALHVGAEVLGALDYAHNMSDAQGDPLHLVNRDVSPANVMVAFDGRVCLIDFGIAQATQDFRSQIGAIRGKLSYMSPEQVRGLPVDGRSDLFSLGVVLYQLLTGTEPFGGDGEFEQMERVRSAEPVAPRSVNPALSDSAVAFLDRALQKDPARRYGSAAEMLAAVTALQAEVGDPWSQSRMSAFMRERFAPDVARLQGRVDRAREILLEEGGFDIPAALHDAPLDGPSLGSLEIVIDLDSMEVPDLATGDRTLVITSRVEEELETNPKATKAGAPLALPVVEEPEPPAPVPRPAPESRSGPPLWAIALLVLLVLAIAGLGLALVIKVGF